MKPKVARQKGAATEEMFCEYLRGFGIPAERRHLAGQYDRGDIAGWNTDLGPVCVEVKSAAVLNIPQWLRELDVEIVNSKSSTGFVAARPKGKPNPVDWWIIMRPEVLIDLMSKAGYL